MKQETISEIKAIIILALGMILLASLMSFVSDDLPWFTSQPNVPAQNLIRITGAYIAGVSFFIFGYSSYCVVAILFFWSWNKFSRGELSLSASKLLSMLVLFTVASSLSSMTGPQEAVYRFERAGIVGLMTSDFLVKYLGSMGAYIILIMLGTLALIITGEFLVTPLIMRAFEKMRGLSPAWPMGTFEKKEDAKKLKPMVSKLEETLKNKQLEALAKITAAKVESKKGEPASNEKAVGIDEKKPFAPVPPVKPTIRIAESKKEEAPDVPIDKPKVVGHYTLPPLDLLQDSPVVSSSKIQSGLMSGAKLLEETLNHFGVNARVVDIERGPAITRFELEPAPGVKVQRITTLSDDIALAMSASTVRIVAPIPGKNRVGIEVPNGASAAVYLKDVLSSAEFRSSKSKLTIALGKDIAGKSVVSDLADMPHLLIAGTTGSGKTVCVNGIIMSLLLNASPDEVKLVMVDPKMVEMAQYNDIPHLLCPTVTDAKKAGAVLNWVVGEMETRYKKLSNQGVRNIVSYNEKGYSMPYIVVIIDELADLMQISAKTVESSITRLAQLSRAVGIHLILATQRPSVNVITGVIKANFPARVSFKVASKVDSRTVLDMNGAETLLGKGDFLFMKPGDAKPTRGQGNFVKDEEINRVMQFIKDQQAPTYDETIIQQQKFGSQSGGEDSHDEYYDEAVKLVIETNQASVSILQRRMRLGYTRAARLIDMMEQKGIVGPYCGSKPRDILVDREQWLLENMKERNEQT